MVFPSVLQENFELVPNFGLPANYSANQAPSTLFQARVEREADGNKSLHLYDADATQSITLNIPFDTQAGEMTLEFDFTATTLGNSCGFYLGSSTGTGPNMEVCLFANASSGFSAFDGSSIIAPSPNVPCNLGQTYRIAVVIDIPAQTFSVYVDETAIMTNYAFRHGMQDTFNLLQFLTMNSSPLFDVSFDNLSIWNEESSGHYFAKMTDSGGGVVEYEPFFFYADTGWGLFYILTDEDIEDYLDNRAEKGFRVVQFVLVSGDFNALDAYGNSFWDSTSPLVPNDDYFNRAADLVDYANALGLEVMLLPTWGDNVTEDQLINLSNAYDFGYYLGNLFAGKQVIWSMGGDRNRDGTADGIDYTPVWEDLVDGLRDGGSGEQMITYHPRGNQSSATWFHQSDWLAFNMNQSGHRRYSNPGTISNPTPKETLITNNRTRFPIKPIFDDESGYEQITEGLDTSDMNDRLSPHDVRVAAYCTVFSGAAGYGYGSNGVFQATAVANAGNWLSDMDWYDAMDRPAATQLTYLQDLLLDGRPFFTRIPAQDMIVSGQGSTYHTVWATRDEKGGYALIYIAEGQAVTLDLTSLAGHYARAYWMDPATGEATAIGLVACEASVAFTPPSSGAETDWVLVLDVPELGWDGPCELFADDFSGTTPGNFPTGWTGSAGDGSTTLLSVVSDASFGNVLRLFDVSDAQTVQATHTFAAQSGPVAIEFDYYGATEGAYTQSRKVYFYIENFGICLYAGPSQFGYHNGDGIVNLAADCSNGVWHHVRVEIDTADNTFNLVINGDRFDGLPFRQVYDEVTRLSILSPTSNQGNQTLLCYLDNIRVTHWNAPASIVKESFNDTDYGELPDGWLGSTSVGSCTLGVVDDPTNTASSKSVLRLYDANDSETIQGIQTFDTQTGQFAVEVDFYGGEESTLINSRSSYLYIGGQSVCLFLSPGSLSYHNGSSIVSLGVTCPNNAWHHLRVELDIDTDTFNVVFDGQRFDGLPFRNAASSIDRLAIMSPISNGGGNVALSYWDNLKVMPMPW